MLSVNKMKKYHKNEQNLTKKVEQLENYVRDQKSNSQFGRVNDHEISGIDHNDNNSYMMSDKDLSKSLKYDKSLLGEGDQSSMKDKSLGYTSNFSSNKMVSKKQEFNNSLNSDLSLKSINSNEELMVLDPDPDQSENVS